MPDAVIKYGMFSTDGSGVLTVHSKHGFKNQAFIVMLVDRGYLVSTNALTTDGIVTLFNFFEIFINIFLLFFYIPIYK